MTAYQARVDPRPVQPPILGLIASAHNVTEGGDELLDEVVNDAQESESNAAGPRQLIPGANPKADYETTSDGSVVHWIRGFSYRPEVCNGGDIIAWDGSGVGTPPAIPGQINVTPFVVEGVDQRSTFGTPHSPDGGEMLEARRYARRQLLGCESKQMERELWKGKLTSGATSGNPHLTDANVVLPEGAAVLGYLTALGVLEQAIADRTCGQQGMIHARRDLITRWDAGGALRRVGNLILTVHDTIIVPGAGYDGSAPDAGVPVPGQVPSADSSWAYATTVVDIRRGAFFNPESLIERVDPSANTLTTYERRAAASTWGCLQVGVHADHVLSLTTTGS